MRPYFASVVVLLLLLALPGLSQDCRPDPTTRTRVTDATQPPYRYICALDVYRGKKKPKTSTGFLVSPTLVVTAGHTVFQRWSRIRRITIRPFANDTILNGPSLTYTRSELSLPVNSRYKGRKGQTAYDYGAIRLLTDSLFRITKGHFFWKANYEYLMDGESPLVRLAGYPCDQDKYKMFEQGGRIGRLKPQTVTYTLYTRKRNSGSPVWVDVDGQAVVVGIHNTGYGKKCKPVRPPKTCSKGARINKDVYTEITSWMN